MEQRPFLFSSLTLPTLIHRWPKALSRYR